MNGRACLALSAIAAMLPGCAMQATTGPTWADERHPFTVVLGATTESSHMNGPTLGGRVGMAAYDGLLPRQGFVHMGWDVRAVPGWFVVEPRLDLGIGRPIAGVYSGVGAYLGGAVDARLRLCGVNNQETAFNIIAPRFDVVLGARIGAWAPPEGNSSQLILEKGLEVGLRFAIGSDVFSGPPGRVRDPVSTPPEREGER